MFNTGCFEGRIGYEQKNAEAFTSVTEFWVEVNGHRFDMANFSAVVLDPSNNLASDLHLMARRVRVLQVAGLLVGITIRDQLSDPLRNRVVEPFFFHAVHSEEIGQPISGDRYSK